MSKKLAIVICVASILLSGINIHSETKNAYVSREITADNAGDIGTLKADLDNYVETKTDDSPYNVGNVNYKIVEVAYKEIGNIGGEKYWRFFGKSEHSNWCAMFVSWCAYQVGYIDAGIMPMLGSTREMEQWFKDRDLWYDADIVPEPGMIIHFDYSTILDYSHQDGVSDHVGIVVRADEENVYIIEGNYNDECVYNIYPLDFEYILGYSKGDF